MASVGYALEHSSRRLKSIVNTNPTNGLARRHAWLRSFALWVVLITSIATPAAATNVWFARQSAVAHMSAADKALLNSTLDLVLNEKPDGSTTTWENPATGSAGRIAVGKTYEDYGTTCRLIKMENTAKTITRIDNYRLCKDNQGEWRFAPASHSDN
jgi:surface antigen